MEERTLNEKESMELISQMIRNAQRRFERVNAAPFLAFGYATIFIALVVWYLIDMSDNPRWNLLWMSIPLVGMLSMKLFFPKRISTVKSFVDKAIDYVWNIIGAVMFMVGILAIFVRIDVMADIILLMGIAMTLTGLFAKLKVIIVGGVLGTLASSLFLFDVVRGVDNILLFAAIVFIIMVVPGHFLYAQKGGGQDV